MINITRSKAAGALFEDINLTPKLVSQCTNINTILLFKAFFSRYKEEPRNKTNMNYPLFIERQKERNEMT